MIKHVDPVIAEYGSEVLRVMFEKRCGVVAATFYVVTQREAYALFEAVKGAVINCIDEYEELREIILHQLKTDRGSLPTRQRTFGANVAAALERKEEEQLSLL
jgi:cobyric acid synthase